MSRVLDFNDTQTSASAPNTTFAELGSYGVYADSTAYITAKGTGVEVGDAFLNSTSDNLNYYDDGGNWRVVATDSSVNANFDTTSGHDHDGTDSKNVLGTNIDSTGGSASQILQADGSGNSTWENNSAAPAFTVLSTSTDVTLATVANEVVTADATALDVTLTLPAVSGNSGVTYRIVKTDGSSNKLSIDPDGSETVNGLATLDLYGQYANVQIACDGTEWFTMSKTREENTFSARIANSGSSTITAQGGVNKDNQSPIVSVNHTALGKTTVTVTTGFFSVIPSITATVEDEGSGVYNAVIESLSASSFEVWTYNTVGSVYNDSNFTIHMHRQGDDYKR